MVFCRLTCNVTIEPFWSVQFSGVKFRYPQHPGFPPLQTDTSYQLNYFLLPWPLPRQPLFVFFSLRFWLLHRPCGSRGIWYEGLLSVTSKVPTWCMRQIIIPLCMCGWHFLIPSSVDRQPWLLSLCRSFTWCWSEHGCTWISLRPCFQFLRELLDYMVI